MTEFQGRPLETLGQDGELALYRGWAADGAPVLIRAPRQEHPAPAVLARLEHEYDLRSELDPAWAACPRALARQGGKLLLVLDDPGGELLESRLGQGLDLGAALRLAVALAQVLGQVHARGLIHKDLCPAHILIRDEEVRLTGFGLASRLPKERQAPESPEIIAGTLPYLAPEQTGRMNRSIDARSDLYALGVILYRLFTGALPFSAADPMEWIHCHIARQPVSPDERVPGLPPPLSAIVMKCLAKTAEDRYQTATGLLYDLKCCLGQWDGAGAIEAFAPGSHDIPDQLRIPEKLYGREVEVATLLAAFDRVMGQGPPELLLVSGYSGVGKSAVVNELHKALVPPRGIFAAGKFDQYKRDIPYATLAQAFQGLIRPLLGKGDAELGRWRDQLRAALEPNAALMVALVPELKLIIGDPPPIPDLPPQDAERRFQLVFRRFVGVFARPEHPLALFLDDLQWLDSATLALLADLATQAESGHLLLVGAYRDNEMDAAHPLMQSLNAIRQAGGAVHEIVLAPLTPEDVRQLVADALRCTPRTAEPLARLVFEKTGGNPFFTIQFLTALADEKLLAFDAGRRGWVWDLKRIRSKGYTDNVVDLMVGKLGRLPKEAQDALTHFACLGNAAHVATLGLVLGGSPEAVHGALWEAVRSGLVLRQDDGGYTFLHDRVQEAAYALVPAAGRKELHLKIGRMLRARQAREAQAGRVFDIVNQLNQCIDLITDTEERGTLRRLNTEAGRKARGAVAYASARRYLAQALALLPADRWSALYSESLALHLDLAECEYLVGNFQRSDQLLSEALDQARSSLDRVRVYRLRQRLYQLSGRYLEAMAVAFEALGLLGVNFPETDEDIRAATEAEIRQVPGKLRGRSIADLAEEPMAGDANVRATIGLLAEAMPLVYVTRPVVWPLITVKGVSLCLQHGHTEESPFVYSCYAMVLTSLCGDIPSAFQFSEMAIRLNERSERAAALRGKLLFHHGAVVCLWCRHFATCLPLLDQAFLALLDAGDIVCAGFLTYNGVWLRLENGDALDDVIETARRYAAFARQSHNDVVYNLLRVEEQFAASLNGRTPSPTDFSDTAFDEAGCVTAIAGAGFRLGVAYYYIMKQMAAFFAERYDESLEWAARAAPMLLQVASMANEATHHFYHALTLAALYPLSSADQQQRFARALGEILPKLKLWAENCPENFENRHALAAAEIARIEGRNPDAMDLYEAAIRSARDNGFVHQEALANELAARFYQARGFDKIAQAYRRDAHYGYLRWGALGKVRALESAWPQLAETEQAGNLLASIGAPVEHLDVATVVKASQAVSSDIVLDRLTATLMRIALEHAGADRGLLLLPQAGSYRIAAQATMDRGELQVALGGGAPTGADLPEALLHYVARSHEPVLLDNASAPSLYSEDPYLAGKAAWSILCLPLIKQAKLSGVLYLENRLTPRAFTRRHLAVLELLASQAAISLENASLYAGLQEREARIRRLVEANIIGIFFWNLAGDVLAANDALLDMVGHTRQDLESGKVRWAAMTPPEFGAADRQALAEIRATGSCRPYEKEYLRHDGSRVPVLVGATLFEGSKDEGVAFVLDLTERKQAEAERQARQAAEAANRAKSEFLANMSHELRSPLNTILGFTRLLLREPAIPEVAREDLGLILKSGEHLHELISEVLDMSKLEAGRTTLNEADFDLDFLLGELKDMLTPAAVQKGLQLVFASRPAVPLCLHGDPLKLRQILINLIGNAIKFTNRGSITVSVENLEPAACGEPHRLKFSVMDTGPGIAPGELEHLFHSFVQARAGREAREGTGLGLAISRGFVQLMGGEMHIDSTEGRGTTVSFDIPALTAENQAIPEEAALPEVVGLAPGQPRYRILAVDDHAEARHLLVRLLSPLGFDIREAANGQEAIGQWRQWQPDLIWMDMRMPVLDGREATRRIRAEQGEAHPVIIALTASSFDEERKDVLASGCDDMLRKPFREAELFAALEKHLGMRFVYQERAPGPTAPPAAPPAVMLPNPLRTQLEEAVAHLDPEGIELAIEAIQDIDMQLAQKLAAAARDFQYEVILSLIREAAQEAK